MRTERAGPPVGPSGSSSLGRAREAGPSTWLARRHRAPEALDVPGPAWEFLTSPSDWTAPALRREWDALSAESRHLRQIYQTSSWFDHVAATGPGRRLILAVKRDDDGRLRGIAPLRVATEQLDFRVGGRLIAKVATRNALILGGLSTVPEIPPILDSLFGAISRALPDCDAIRLACVPVASHLWGYLRTARLIRDNYLLHVVQSVGPYHVLHLPPTFQEYLARYSAKRRYNLKRQARLLRERGGGRLELHRVETPAMVPFLLEAEAWMRPDPPRTAAPAGQVEGTWSADQVRDLAERGFLRGYVLLCGDDPVGLIKGVQYERTYSVMDTLYRDDHAEFSPGTTTLYLAIEDLLTHRPVETIDFGFGQPRQAVHPSDLTLDMESILLMRKTFGNRLRRRCHAAFCSAVGIARRIRDRI